MRADFLLLDDNAVSIDSFSHSRDPVLCWECKDKQNTVSFQKNFAYWRGVMDKLAIMIQHDKCHGMMMIFCGSTLERFIVQYEG